VHRVPIAVVAGLGITALVGLVWLGATVAGDPAKPLVPNPSPIAGAVDRGRHVRIDGPRGPIHVWIPASYQPDTGATIVYVHGYWDTADTAWANHQLPQQFALSALNAVFIVPEAPQVQKVPVNYPDLTEVLRAVEDATGIVRGAAYTAVLAHSGAYRTIETWLDEPLIDALIMIDALYGDEDKIVAWARASSKRRLILVGQDTVIGTEAVASRVPETLTLDRFPPTFDTWPPEAKTSRSIYVRSQYGHMPLVTDGIAIPSLLRLLPIELLPDLPWKLPLGSLLAPPPSAPPPPTQDEPQSPP
jgi:hypothetical protein